MLHLKMKNLTLISLTFATLLLVACTGNSDVETDTDKANCENALVFENAKLAESMVDKNYSGELNNYWGEDTTKLDFKHVFKNGKLVKSYFYFENQNVQEEYSFKCGALHGLQKWYYENGKLAQTIPYSYGYRNGIGRMFDKDGFLSQKVTFKNDSIIGKIQSFDKSGKLIKNDTISENK
jgi:antitoxin component YwqK of YwqJK toxin-antitoxin module